MAKIYVASSWRNPDQPHVVQVLEGAGHAVYDFRNPPDRKGGFQWSEIDPDWESWTPEAYRTHLLTSPVASHGFVADMRALQWCDVCLLVMPCGRSAHLELGWACGRGKRTIVYLNNSGEPELMNLMADHIAISLDEVLFWLHPGTSQNF